MGPEVGEEPFDRGGVDTSIVIVPIDSIQIIVMLLRAVAQVVDFGR